MMVADTGPLIAFARLGSLDILRQVTGGLIIPEAVPDELVARGRQRLGVIDVEQAEWIQCKATTNQAAASTLPSTLHTGE